MSTIYHLGWDTSEPEAVDSGIGIVVYHFPVFQILKPIPLVGQHLYELIVNYKPAGNSAVCAWGIVNRGFVGDFLFHEGIGYVNLGYVFREGKPLGRIASFESGDTAAMLVDRAAGQVRFFMNGHQQRMYINDMGFGDTQLYIGCILYQKAVVTLREHRVDAATDLIAIV